MINNLENLLVCPDQSVKSAIEVMGRAGRKVVFVTAVNKTLLGIFTDGDMRRYILKGGDLFASIGSAMNKSPYILKTGWTHDDLQSCFVAEDRFVCPIVDGEGKLIEAIFRTEYSEKLENFSIPRLPPGVHTVIMAGGFGKRLYPYTKVLPKALVPIGDKPILTHIINKFMGFGCEDFHLIVNHKRNLIKAYYAEENLPCRISYYDEETPLGPAGGLYLLKGKMKSAFFMSNCDSLVEADYAQIYNFHKREGNVITAVGALRDVEVPYGVFRVKGEGSAIESVDEKPSQAYLANVGVYLFEPEVLDAVEDNKFLLTTDLIMHFVKAGRKVGVYPVDGEAWQDMGQLDEMKKMAKNLERKQEQDGK